ncbi:MAG: GGDEF domain-containing protein [Ktedonobacteraceae bacterium]
MKQSFQSLLSWWYATMVPVRTHATTLVERENLRKRKLLSAVILMSIVLILAYLVLGFSVSSSQTLFILIDVGILLGALWCNRQGYLKCASLLYFFMSEICVLQGVHVASSSDPFTFLWACFLATAYLGALGLFLSAWMLILLTGVEYLVLLWYLLVFCHTQVIHLLSPVELQNFLAFLTLLVCCSGVIGALYSTTTKNAVIQADRASELEHANAELERAHATIQQQALTDGLTGLPNHRAIMDQLHKDMEHARRYERPFSLLFFDADFFKKVNDTHGHATGDAVLRQIGTCAASVLRSGDTLGRFGGEEFVILLPEADASEACLIAERIRTTIAAHPVAPSTVEGGLPVTVSIGLASYLSDGTSEQELLARADEAMYLAKCLGRNQVRTSREAREMSTDADLMAHLHQQVLRESAEREKGILARSAA